MDPARKTRSAQKPTIKCRLLTKPNPGPLKTSRAYQGLIKLRRSLVETGPSRHVGNPVRRRTSRASLVLTRPLLSAVEMGPSRRAARPSQRQTPLLASLAPIKRLPSIVATAPSRHVVDKHDPRSAFQILIKLLRSSVPMGPSLRAALQPIRPNRTALNTSPAPIKPPPSAAEMAPNRPAEISDQSSPFRAPIPRPVETTSQPLAIRCSQRL
jgi:hypothetical protein